MAEDEINQEAVTILFIDRVKSERVSEFDRWLKNIHAEAKKFDGFIDVSSVRTNHSSTAEFVTQLSFKTKEHLHTWVGSAQSDKWVRQLPSLLAHEQSTALVTGLAPWIPSSRPESADGKKPPYWKQVVVGIITVYPVILLLNFFLFPLFGSWPLDIRILLVTIILSCLLTWPIMPVANILLKHWLYEE